MNRASDIVHAMCEGIRRDRSEKILKEFGIETDDDLVKRLAFEYYGLRTRMISLNERFDKIMEENNNLRNKVHIYKIELRRCQRKLTRIYKFFNDVIYFANERSAMSFQSANPHKESAILHNAIARIIRALDRKTLRKL